MKQSLNPEELRIIGSVKKASPAVVSIVVSADVPKLDRCMVPPGYPAMCQNGTVKRPISAGTGFLVTADGYILTNKHVVNQHERQDFVVILNDENNKGRKVPAKVISIDPTSDIAVMKIEMKNLPSLTFADSSDLQVGQTALAIGYTLGQFANSVSKGVVSGLSRSIVAGDFNGMAEQLFGIIQTDAAINFGNSGGPLINSEGRVIGMSVASAMFGQAIGFALPANELKKAFEMVKKTGKISRPYFGVRSMQLNQILKEEAGIPSEYGSLVMAQGNENPVVSGSPAQKAGIIADDIILKWNSKKIDDDHPLAYHLSLSKVGDVIMLDILRGTKIFKTSCTLADWPAVPKGKVVFHNK